MVGSRSELAISITLIFSPPDVGTTESGGLATFTGAGDVLLGSSGSLLPTVQAKLIEEDGSLIVDYGVAGEILLKSPSVVAGYLNGEDGELMTSDGWLCTGDVGLFRKSPEGNDHLFVVDRLKDMLKVKVCHLESYIMAGNLPLLTHK